MILSYSGNTELAKERGLYRFDHSIGIRCANVRVASLDC